MVIDSKIKMINTGSGYLLSQIEETNRGYLDLQENIQSKTRRTVS